MMYYGNDFPSSFEFDKNSGDMVLRFSLNETYFDSFRDKMETNDVGVEPVKYYRNYSYKEEDLVEEDPDIDWASYRQEHGRSRYDYTTKKYVNDSDKKNVDYKFSITLRANAKRKFKFYESWDARMKREWVIPPKADSPHNGYYKYSEDEVDIYKDTNIDRRWVDKYLKQYCKVRF